MHAVRWTSAMNLPLTGILGGILASFAATLLVAGDGDLGDSRIVAAQVDSPARNAGSGRAQKLPNVTPEREAAVMKFVEQHHSDLAALLTHLKDSNHQEYDRAIRDIFRASERLVQTRQRDDRRYEIELQQWQNQSRIDLLTARLKMANSDEYREQLRGLLAERIDLKLAMLQLDRERLTERLRKTEQQLGALEASRSSQIDNQMRVILGTGKPATRPRDAKGGAAKDKSTGKGKK